MQIQSLGQEDPLEEGMAIHSSVLAWRIQSHGQRRLVGYSHGVAELYTTEETWHPFLRMLKVCFFASFGQMIGGSALRVGEGWLLGVFLLSLWACIPQTCVGDGVHRTAEVLLRELRLSSCDFVVYILLTHNGCR